MMKTWGLLVLALVMCVSAWSNNNPYGVQVAITGNFATEYASKHFEDASRFAGEWGHIRVGADIFETLRGEGGAINTLILCRAKKLIPIFTGWSEPFDSRELDLDGTYDSQAVKFREWATMIRDAGFRIPYYEVGNEPQGRIPAEVHARWCMSVAKAINSVDPDTKVSPAGMVGAGDEYYIEMLEAVPELKDYMRVWSCHPYASNRPPEYDQDSMTIQGYLWTIRALESMGVEDPKIIGTETGWEIRGMADKRFPYITEELRAEYLVDAYTKYWARDPRVVAITPFMLQSIPWTGWETWDFIREDGTYTPMYKAIAALPKPQGSDYNPRGYATLSGRVIDEQLAQGVYRSFAYIVPRQGVGAYAAETDAAGMFIIENVPEGDYYLHAFKSYYRKPARIAVTLENDKNVWQEIFVRRTGMVRRGFNNPESNPMMSEGFAPITMDPDHCAWDGEVGRTHPGSIRIIASPGQELGYWHASGYCAGLPGESYAMEIYVRTENFDPGPDGYIRVQLDATNAHMLPYAESWIDANLTGTNDWTPVTVSVYAPEKTRRHRLAFSVLGESGTVWFDDVFADKAELPLPSAIQAWSEPRTGTITGHVMAVDESYLHNATVFTNPGSFFALTDRVGRYTLELPPGTYQVSVSHASFAPAHAYEVVVADNESAVVDLEMPLLDYPIELANADMERHGLEPSAMIGWKPYGICDGVNKNGWMAGRADPDHPGYMARSGESFLGHVSAYNTKTGSSYQTVRVEPNALYELSAWIKTSRRGGTRGDVANRIGIDPMGLDDPESPYIIWTPYRPSPDRWSQITLQAYANRDRMTVFLGHQMISGIQWSGNFFDDVELKKIADPSEEMPDPGTLQGGTDAHLPYDFGH